MARRRSARPALAIRMLGILALALPFAPRAGWSVQSASWSSAASGDWIDPTRWSTDPYFPNNGSPSPTDRYDASITATGARYTIRLNTDIALENLVLNSVDATVSHESGILDVAGTATLSAGTFLLDGGTLRGGTWDLQGGSLAFAHDANNALDATLVRGDLRLGSGLLSLRNGANFTGTLDLGPAAFLRIQNDVRFDGNTINLTSLNVGPSQRTISIDRDATLTLGASTLVNLAAPESNLSGAGTLVNEGTIRGASRFSTMTIAPDHFFNRGLVEAVSSLNFRVGLFSDDQWTNEASGTIRAVGDSRISFYGKGLNQGTLSARDGAELFIGGAWNNDGIVELVNSSKLMLSAALRTEDLGTINASGSSLVTIGGTLDNTAQTLTLAASGPRYRLDRGSIVGGTIIADRPLEFAPLAVNSPTQNRLDGVFVQGSLDLTATSSAAELTNGATFTGRADIGSRGALGFNQTSTLDGVTVALASGTSSFNGSSPTRFGVAGTNTLTLGPATLVQLTGNVTALTSDVLQDGTGTIVNRGTITTGGPGYSSQWIDPDVFVNEGTVNQAPNTTGVVTIGKSDGTWTNAATGTIALTGRTLTFEGTGTNLGSISIASSPLLMDGDWNNDGTIDVRDATLILGGQYSTDDIGTVRFFGNASTTLRGVLDNTGSALDLAILRTNPVDGTVLGGTLTDSRGAVVAANAVFDGALIDDSLSIFANSYATFRSGARATGPIAIGLRATLDVDDSTVLDYPSIGLEQGSILQVSGSHTLTIGSSTTVDLTGRRATIGSNVNDPGGAVVNQGTIRARNSIDFAISPDSFTNEGIVLAENQAQLAIGSAAARWVNAATGTIRANASTVSFLGDWTNLGAIELTNATLRLGGSLVFADIGRVTRDASSQIAITGELDNRNRTLDLPGSIGGLTLDAGSKITGGTVVQSAAARLLFGVSSLAPSTLDGVAVQGGLDLSSGRVQLVNGSTWSGIAQLGKAGNTGQLGIAETRELDGIAVQIEGDAISSDFGRAAFGIGGTNVLTLGPSSTVSLSRSSGLTSDLFQSGTGTILNRGTITALAGGGNPNIDPDVFVNEGLVVARAAGSILEIGDPGKSWTNRLGGRIEAYSGVRFDGVGLNLGAVLMDGATMTLNGDWSNQGAIDLRGGAKLELGGTFQRDRIGIVQRSANTQVVLTGVLDNSGDDLFAATNFGNLTVNRGTIRGGLVNQTPEKRLAFIGGLSTFNFLDNVRVTGGLDLSAVDTHVTLLNGASFSGIAEIGPASTLYGPTGNVDDVVFNLRGTNSFATVQFGGNAVLGVRSELNFLGQYGQVYGTELVLRGRITSAGPATYHSTIDVDAFENQGGIEVSGGELTIDCGACRNFDFVHGILTGGEWTVGAGARLLIRTPSALDPDVLTNQANVTLRGAGSRFDSLDSLEVNDRSGTLRLLDGRGFSAPNGFTNLGEMSVAGGRLEMSLLENASGAKLDITGTLVGDLENHGALSIVDGGLGDLRVDQNIVLTNESTLSLEIGAASDRLSVGGNLSLSGILAIGFASGARPTEQDVFELASVSGAILGAFANVASGERLGVSGGGGSFEIRYGEGAFANRIVAMNFIPEPQTALLVALGLFAMAHSRRNRVNLRTDLKRPR